MQIVIDIPEGIYNRIISWKENTICNSENPYIAKAIKNGTPLPEKHGRLIDADELFDEFCEIACEPYINAPTILKATEE